MKGVLGTLINGGAKPVGAEQMVTIYKRCAHCGASIKLPPVASSSTPAATLWSDGYLESPDVHEPLIIGKCRACEAIGCLAELPTIEGVPQTAQLNDHTAAPLTVDNYAMLLDNLQDISAHYHVYLRVRFWQLNNHQRRGLDSSEPLSEAERANMVELLKLLGRGDAERLMAAEILRQLQDFEGAESLLAGSFDEAATLIAEHLRRAVKTRNPGLVKLFSHEPQQMQG